MKQLDSHKALWWRRAVEIVLARFLDRSVMIDINMLHYVAREVVGPVRAIDLICFAEESGAIVRAADGSYRQGGAA